MHLEVLDTTVVHHLLTGMVITDVLLGRTLSAAYILMDMYPSGDNYGILHVDTVSGKWSLKSAYKRPQNKLHDPEKSALC